MTKLTVRRPTLDDLDAVVELGNAFECAFIGAESFTRDELAHEWRQVDLEQDAWLVVGPRGRLAGYALLEDGGENRFYRMTIELGDEPPHLEWPDGIRVEPFAEEHALAFHEAIEDAWQDHWGYSPRPFEQFRERLLTGVFYDPSLWTVAWAGDEIAGGTICEAGRYDMGWVRSLSVRRPWRRQGLGMALLLNAFQQFHERGERHVGLGVDAESPTGATRLYERAGMEVVEQTAIYRKHLI